MCHFDSCHFELYLRRTVSVIVSITHGEEMNGIDIIYSETCLIRTAMA